MPATCQDARLGNFGKTQGHNIERVYLHGCMLGNSGSTKNHIFARLCFQAAHLHNHLRILWESQNSKAIVKCKKRLLRCHVGELLGSLRNQDSQGLWNLTPGDLWVTQNHSVGFYHGLQSQVSQGQSHTKGPKQEQADTESNEPNITPLDGGWGEGGREQ